MLAAIDVAPSPTRNQNIARYPTASLEISELVIELCEDTILLNTELNAIPNVFPI